MKAKLLGVVLAAALCGSTAMATNVNLRVQGPNGEPTVNVAPGGIVSYRVVAELSDNLNEGLALVGFSLDYTGGAIGQQGNTPNSAPMMNFVMDAGITNPAGFGGTMIGGELIQCGGAQNTIKNTVANAPFPIGTVITGIASFGAPAVVLTGSFTKPAGPGDFQLVAFDVFANVITDGETGEVFWATQAAGVGTITNLTITGGVDANLVLPTNPACGVSWPRSANNFAFLEFDADLAAPLAGQVQIRELLAGGTFGADLSANFTFSIQNNGAAFPRVLTIRETGTRLADRKWYAITNNGWAGVAAFKVDIVHLIGDADGNGRTLGADASLINSQISPLLQPDKRTDIDGNGRVLGADFSLANSKISPLAVTKPTGHTCSP